MTNLINNWINQYLMRFIIPTVCFLIIGFAIVPQNVFGQFDPSNWTTIGRGQVEWDDTSVFIKDCFIANNDSNSTDAIPSISTKSYNYRKDAIFCVSTKTPKSETQLQSWIGFGYHDRENRYALGLRGGNNNDLYLCRYQSNGKNKMLALEPLDFKPIPGEWYKIKIVFWDGNIRIYLNDRTKPYIAIKDDEPLESGNIVLGGGWINTEFKDLITMPLTDEKIEHYASDTITTNNTSTFVEKESERKNQRTDYQIKTIQKINSDRTTINMEGNWLFKPEFEISNLESAISPNINDQDWHIMHVPDFWNTVGNWMHLQDSKLPHSGSGVSDNYREKEENRCKAYTFDSEKTTAAWYRHWIDLPDNIDGKIFKLRFDAVSKVADVYVNGEYAGGHVGMFGDFEVDITDNVKAGKNLIAVNVKVRKYEKQQNADENVTRAVSVDINNDMLNSLPHGMFKGTEGGIWQPVKLIITQPVYISDVFANVRMDGGDFEITLDNNSNQDEEVKVKIQITDNENQQVFYSSEKGENAVIDKETSRKVIYRTGTINPKLWSPENPNLYTLKVLLFKQNEQIDELNIKIGFREFTANGNQFYLNGKPYWIRGANHPPCGIAANDKPLANKFFQLMHNGNQLVTRSHGSPFTETWMNAADEQGVGVSYEGSWPWLMISDIPSQELLDIWKQEMLSLVKKYRNHPSLLIWTINNEMYFTMFYHNDPPEIRQKKWKILSEVVKEIRRLSPGIPISADSGYGRVKADYDKNLKPNNIDDGDIDDRHIYFNWYNRDFFQVIDGEWDERIYWSPGANPDRPFFSQEASTGYPNNDDGHFTRKYIYKHYVPQAWVGDWAYEDKDPAFGLQRHAFMTKELMEVIRRTSPKSAGVLLFANVCWYQNVFDADNIQPYPVHESVKLANQDVLVSAELFGRNFYAGATITPRVCIVNDAINGNKISKPEIFWEIVHNGNILSSGSQKTGDVPYYERSWTDVTIKLPDNLPQKKFNCQLKLTVKSNGNIITKNQYDLLIAVQPQNIAAPPTIQTQNTTVQTQYFAVQTQDFAVQTQDFASLPNTNIAIYDTTNKTCKLLDFLKIPYKKLNDLTEIRTTEMGLLIVANLDSIEEVPYNWEDVRKIAGNGTNVLLIHPGKQLKWLLPDKIASVYERKGRIVNMHIPESSVFDNIEPMELAWWQQEGREKPRACRRSFRFKNKNNIIELVTYLRPHVYLANPEEQLYEMSGSPLMEITEKKGKIVVCEMEVNRGVKDPIAAQLFINLIKTYSKNTK